MEKIEILKFRKIPMLIIKIYLIIYVTSDIELKLLIIHHCFENGKDIKSILEEPIIQERVSKKYVVGIVTASTDEKIHFPRKNQRTENIE